MAKIYSAVLKKEDLNSQAQNLIDGSGDKLVVIDLAMFEYLMPKEKIFMTIFDNAVLKITQK